MSFKFDMQWLLNQKEDELNKIEIELLNISNKINQTRENKKDYLKSINNVDKSINSFKYPWEYSNFSNIKKYYEDKIEELEKQEYILCKDKSMLISRYKNKNNEIHLLEKLKSRKKLEYKIKEEKKEIMILDEYTNLKSILKQKLIIP